MDSMAEGVCHIGKIISIGEWFSNEWVQDDERSKTRGPLSPFLFILAVESLNRFFAKAKDLGKE